MSGSSANGYKEFLKHLGIDPTLMADDMRSRLPDSEKHRVILTTKAQKSLKGGMCTCSERGGEMKKKVIYVSGKITGTSDYVARFSTVEDKLIAEGYEVLNPVREGKRLEHCLEPEKPTWVQYMKYAIATMMKADYIYMMSGWKQSKGARLEHFLARALNYNIIYEEQAE